MYEVLWKFEPPRCSHTGGWVVAELTKEPAYVLLRVKDNEPLHDSLQFTINYSGYMKPDAFKDTITPNKYINYKRTEDHRDFMKKGPTLQSGYIKDPLKTEITPFLKCQSWPFITDVFYTRERLTNWPSKELLKRIYKIGCQVVSVGHYSSSSKEMEWRMSFSIAEKELCFEILEPYAKVMFALKSIKKNYLELQLKPDEHPAPFCSYFIKTACFWMCETVPHMNLSTVDLVRMTLDWLIDCYEHKMLPHYFIPTQNLIGHLTRKQYERMKIALLKAKTKLWLVTKSSMIENKVRHIQNNMGNEQTDLLNFFILRHNYKIPQGKAEIVLDLKLKSSKHYHADLPSFIVSRYKHCEQSWEKLIVVLEKFMNTMIKYMEKTVPGYVKLFKHHFYFTLGDTCTSIQICTRNRCLHENVALPLYYYKLGSAIVHPDGWRDNLCIGTQVHTIRYYYLMGNYEQLRLELSKFEPQLAEVKQNVDIVNGLRKIIINMRSEHEIYAWINDKDVLQRIKDFTKAGWNFVMFNPILFILYVKATLSLQGGKIDKASIAFNYMKECFKMIYNPDERWFSNMLLDIINIKITK